jgi:hypothetical protein
VYAARVGPAGFPPNVRLAAHSGACAADRRIRQRAMRADDFDIPAGQPFRKVRDFLRAEREIFTPKAVVQHFGADITDELQVKGLIEPYVSPSGETIAPNWFQVSSLGLRLANVRLIPRIPRAKAEKDRCRHACASARHQRYAGTAVLDQQDHSVRQLHHGCQGRWRHRSNAQDRYDRFSKSWGGYDGCRSLDAAVTQCG